MGNHESEGLTRRETLKRGLKLTGTVLWMTPVVQAIGMSPALAQPTSAVPCADPLRAKYEVTGNAWENPPGVGAQPCDNCQDAEGVDGDQYFTIVAVVDDEGETDQVTVTLKPGTNCEITSIAAKGGSGVGSCSTGVVAPDRQSATVERPIAGGISNVVVCFCCDNTIT